MRALKRFNAENESTYLTLMKATIGDAIGINGGSDEIDLLTRRVETLNKRMITLVNETIQSGSVPTEDALENANRIAGSIPLKN